MGYMSILMWIKRHYDQNTFTGLEIILQYLTKIHVLKISGKVTQMDSNS